MNVDCFLGIRTNNQCCNLPEKIRPIISLLTNQELSRGIFSNLEVQAAPEQLSSATPRHAIGFSRPRHETEGLSCSFLRVGDVVSLWEECCSSEMSAGCQSARAEARGEGKPRGSPGTNKRGICEWKPSSVILKKLSPPPCATDQQGAACSGRGLLAKRQNPLSLLPCFNLH